MYAYHRFVAPTESTERNPFVAIAALVILLALVAGFGVRYGMNMGIAVICVIAAMVGTWLLLSPQLERAEVQGNVGTAAGTESQFASTAAPGRRQRLRQTPRVAVGFDAEGNADSAGGSGAKVQQAADVFDDSVVMVRPLGQLPTGAQALEVATELDVVSPVVQGAYTLGRFEVRAVSRRGSDHTVLDEPRQDDFVVAQAAGGRYLVIVVADGRGVAEHGHYGAYWSCRLLARAIDQNLRDGVPGMEKMLERTRSEVTSHFNAHFPDGTKMRSIATTLVGLIAPIDGGPAAGFRVGDSDILIDGDAGWTSIFATGPGSDDAVFPKSIDAEIAPIALDSGCLLLATDGITDALAASSTLSDIYSTSLASVSDEAEFCALAEFDAEQFDGKEGVGDRTAVGVWFT